MKKTYSGSTILVLGMFMALAAQNITNFASPKGVFDVEFMGDTVWVATSGGLYNYQFSNGKGSMRSASRDFPDPSIRALCIDGRGNLWAGTRSGFLLMRNRAGKEYVNSAYAAAGWSISDLVSIGKYLVIASDKGVSLFDTDKRIGVKNATRIGKFTSPQIFTVAVFKNELYVGGESGLARLRYSIDKIEDVNFYDPSVWRVDSSVKGPVHNILIANGHVKACKGASGLFFDLNLTADSNKVIISKNTTDTIRAVDSTDTADSADTANMADTANTLRFESNITVIKVRDEKTCFFGTESNGLFYWADTSDKPYLNPIPGPTFSAAQRVFVDRSGALWVLPYGITSGAAPWWLGINSFDGKAWNNYGPVQYPEMGIINTPNAFGILQTMDGTMWFGFEGGQVKSYNPAAGGWFHYCVFGQGGDGNGAFIKTQGECPEPNWGKCDVLAQDSAGYMWISSWNNAAGALLCYKPALLETNELTLNGQRLYRRFSPSGVNISAITVDRDQHIIFGLDIGKLTVAEKADDPLNDPTGLRVLKEFNNLGNIFKLVALGDGSTLAITAGGVYRLDPAKLSDLSLLDNFGKNITTMAVENEAVFWYGNGEGLVRHDVLTNEKTVFNGAHGLASNNVKDVFVDKKNGCVWVATDAGVSRLALGYTAASALQKHVVVFPNPFSRRAHSVVYFRNVPPDGVVTVHSLSGALVGKPELIRKGEGGAAYRWVPPPRLLPGTYFYAVVAPTMRSTGKFMLTP